MHDEHALHVGETTFITVFGYASPATVLAILGDAMLLEYDMGSYSALRIVPVSDPDTRHYRNVTYRELPRKWLQAVDRTGIEWLGVQKGRDAPAPQPAEMLAQRNAQLEKEAQDRIPTSAPPAIG
jgi:hypothetical protein